MHHLSEIPQNAIHIVELIVKTTFNHELVEFVVGWISRIKYKKGSMFCNRGVHYYWNFSSVNTCAFTCCRVFLLNPIRDDIILAQVSILTLISGKQLQFQSMSETPPTKKNHRCSFFGKEMPKMKCEFYGVL